MVKKTAKAPKEDKKENIETKQVIINSTPSKSTSLNMILSGSYDLTHQDIEALYSYCGRKIREYHERHLI